LQLAWLSPQLEGSCVSGVRLRAVAGAHGAAAEDLLHVVSQAPRLENLATFQSVRIDLYAGNLTFSIEEVEMHARPLNSQGVPCGPLNRASLPNYASTQALLVQDIYVRGRSILRLAS
jgi:hypothetical protein